MLLPINAGKGVFARILSSETLGCGKVQASSFQGRRLLLDSTAIVWTSLRWLRASRSPLTTVSTMSPILVTVCILSVNPLHIPGQSPR